MAETDMLEVPEVARHDAKSFEILRVWIANDSQQVSLRVGVWEDPAGWGIMLADLARHVSNAYFQEKGFDKRKTLQRVIEGLSVELSSPTD